MKKLTKKELQKIKEFFIKNYSNAKTELNYKNDYELLIAIILSAQCTDKRVNIITPALFEKYPSVFDLAKAKIEDIKELIKTCSFFNNKAKNLLSMAKKIVNEYNGKIPDNEKELIKLPGVGQKTANVFMIEFHNKNLMAVDTHVFRVSHRLRMSEAKTVEQTEKDLVKLLRDDLHIFHQGMVLFGRYKCKAKNPECLKCELKEICSYKNGS